MYDIFYIDVPPREYPQAKKVETLEEAQEQSRTRYCWVLDGRNDYSGFDIHWEPYDWEAHQVHIWPSQHQENGGTYLIPKRTFKDLNRNHELVPRDRREIKIIYIMYKNEGAEEQLQRLADAGFSVTGVPYIPGIIEHYQKKVTEPTWIISSLNDYSDFDFTWHPSEWNTELIQVWPSQHQEIGDTYLVPNTKEEGYDFHEDVVLRKDAAPIIYLDHGNEDSKRQFNELLEKYKNVTEGRFVGDFEGTVQRYRRKIDQPTWIISSLNDYGAFDFTWHPEKWTQDLIQVIPTQHQDQGGTYYVTPLTDDSDPKDVNYVKELVAPRKNVSPIVFIDHGNAASEERFEFLKERFSNVIKTRYVGSLEATVARIRKNIAEPTWIVSSLNDYRDFDFTWHPSKWNKDETHVWPSQHQNNGGTYYVTPSMENKPIPDVNYNRKVVVPRRTIPPVIYIEHGNEHMITGHIHGAITYTTRFINDYLGTLKRALRQVEGYDYSCHAWVLSSVCNYDDFDLTWHPSEFQKEMLHVFPSNEQKFGDTFYVHIPTFLEQAKNLELLEWYDTICFQDKEVVRTVPPIYLHEHDNHTDAVVKSSFIGLEDPDAFRGPLTVFSTTSQFDNNAHFPAINLWRPKTRTITPLDPGAERVIIPKEAFGQVKNELYDYPYIDTSYKNTYESTPLDIIFMSNGEECAEDNYKHLLSRTCDKNNKLRWVSDVEGRIASAREAAKQSRTDWFFSVNAKLKVDPNFDWDWQPDRMQAKKHYIFYAYNPYTDDTYGHMAMIAWNKDLVLTDTDWGLDFTLSHPHEVVPILSGEAIYGDNPWDAWRTAFREVIKLQASRSEESMERLKRWASSEHEATSRGACDAALYYAKVCGDMDKLMLTFDWAFLEELYKYKYG